MAADDICREIRLHVSTKWTIGDVKRDSAGNPLAGIREYSYCLFMFDHIPGDNMAEILAGAIQILSPFRKGLLEITDTGGSVDFSIGCFFHSNSGEELDWPLLKEIADLRIRLALSFYPETPKSAA